MPLLDSFVFQSADKTGVQGFMVKPPGFDSSKKYPMKFLIHGGPQGAGKPRKGHGHGRDRAGLNHQEQRPTVQKSPDR